VLGKFQEMLTATAFHPAMMLYLDNKESIAPEIAQPGPNMTVHLGRARGLNENYSRELMELHTLGVDGGYTQKDIEAAARTFTGLSLQAKNANTSQGEPAKVELLFYSWAHDPSDKVVLGETIPTGESEEVLKLLEILARHPSTSRHISKRLAQRFVADNPPPALVDRMAKTFRETDGDLREVMTTMLTSPEFFAEDVRQGKTKSPLELVTSAVRTTNAEISNPAVLATRIAAMGQALYNKPEPTGYPNTGETWINAARLVERVNFGTNLVTGKIAGVVVDPSQWDGSDLLSMGRQILGRDPAPQTLEALK
jgi:uncharacterized protein (DUF1800 family)